MSGQDKSVYSKRPERNTTMAQKEENLMKFLNKIATEHKYENPEISINEISSDGANCTSKLYTAIIRGDNKEDLHLFAKVATAGEAFRSELPSDIFDTEQFFYTKLSKIYAALEEENQVPEEHRLLFTKFYGVNPTRNQEIMVLENLFARGYGNHDRFNSIDWEYASSAVTALAKMHALSFAYSKKNPKEFENTVKALKMNWKDHGSMDDLMLRSISVALNKVNPKNKEALQKFMANRKNPYVMYGAIRSNVIIHADFRGNNLLHRVREKLPFGLIIAVHALPLLTLDSENAPQIDESLEFSEFPVEKTSDLYVVRLNGVVNDYVKWGILK